MESLINLGDITKRGTAGGDVEQSRVFVQAWNEKYPDYPCRIVRCPHDFGSYADVQIGDELFSQGLGKSETFPKGIETAATDLADALSLSY